MGILIPGVPLEEQQKLGLQPKPCKDFHRKSRFDTAEVEDAEYEIVSAGLLTNGEPKEPR